MEEWKDIPSMSGVQASSLGRIMVKPFQGMMPQGGIKLYGGVPTLGQWDGKRFIYVRKNKTYKVARLVCEAFHGSSPEGKKIFMHLDENSRNNKPENLQWGTQKENLNAPGFIAYCKTRTGYNNPQIKGKRKTK